MPEREAWGCPIVTDVELRNAAGELLATASDERDGWHGMCAMPGCDWDIVGNKYANHISVVAELVDHLEEDH